MKGRQTRQQLGFEQKVFSSIFTCTNEDEVAEIVNELDASGKIRWEPFGGTLDNMGTIQNQAKDSVGALVEKATNSIDAVILKEVKKRRL